MTREERERAVQPIDSDDFVALKREIEGHRRLAGYYLIKLVDITRLRANAVTEEEVLEALFQTFDDQRWPDQGKRPHDQSWTDYLADRATARKHAVESMVGGPDVGHIEETIKRDQAEVYFERFDALFEPPKEYYVGMGFGDQRYVFSGGAAIVCRERAGILWVVEDD